MQELDIEAMAAEHELIDREYRATLTAQQKLEYMVWCGELAESCPNCGKRYVDVEYDSYPDYIGTAYTTEYLCCGFTETGNTAFHYDENGKLVDIA